MASQSLNTKGIENKLTNLFHGNLGKLFILTHDVPNHMDNHFLHNFHNYDSLCQGTSDQIENLDHEVDRLEQLRGQERVSS